MKGSEPLYPRNSVSVIIPTRDRPALLREAVESLLCQSRLAAEIIVIDDASRAENRREIMKIGGIQSSGRA